MKFDGEWFRVLEPPPGGVARFRTRLEQLEGLEGRAGFADLEALEGHEGRQGRGRSRTAGPRPATVTRQPHRIMVAGLAMSVLLIAISIAGLVRFASDAGTVRPDEPFASAGASVSVGSAAPVVAVTRVAEAPEFDRLLGRPLRPAELSVAINDEPAAVFAIPTSKANVRIYEIRR